MSCAYLIAVAIVLYCLPAGQFVTKLPHVLLHKYNYGLWTITGNWWYIKSINSSILRVYVLLNVNV